MVVVGLAVFVAPLLRAQGIAPVAAISTQPKSADRDVARVIPFEVVSIRPSLPGHIHGDFFTDDGFSVSGMMPHTLLTYMSKRLEGVPDWCNAEHYDIVAKVAEADVPAWKNMNFKQKSQAIQPMLEDRFKLKWHMETKIESGYELVIAKNGSKLKEPTAEELDLRAKDPTPGHAIEFGGTRGGPMELTGKASGMDLLIYYLQEIFLHAPVADKTGLGGMYNFKLAAAPERNPNAPPDYTPPVVDGPSIFSAVQEQLGLKLVPGKVPVEYVVIDHIERPTAN